MSEAKAITRWRFSLASLLWATIGCALLFAMLRTVLGYQLIYLLLSLIGFSACAGGALAAECGKEAFLQGFCMAMVFYSALLAAVAAALIATV